MEQEQLFAYHMLTGAQAVARLPQGYDGLCEVRASALGRPPRRWAARDPVVARALSARLLAGDSGYGYCEVMPLLQLPAGMRVVDCVKCWERDPHDGAEELPQ